MVLIMIMILKLLTKILLPLPNFVWPRMGNKTYDIRIYCNKCSVCDLYRMPPTENQYNEFETIRLITVATMAS